MFFTRVRSGLWRRKKTLFAAVLIGLLIYGMAHTRPALEFAERQSRGTSWEPAVSKWTLSIHGQPVEKALARGNIFDGQPVDEVVALHGPFRTTVLDGYTLLDRPGREGAFDGYQIVAKDGIVRSADWWTCTARLAFFDSLSDEEKAECSARYEQQRFRLGEAKRLTRMATAGSWAYPDPLTMDPPDARRDARIAVGGLGTYTEPQTPVSPHDD